MNATYTPGPNEQTSLGMSWKAAIALGYIFGIVGVVFFFVEKQSRFIRFHCAQSAAMCAICAVLWVLNFIPYIGAFVAAVVGLAVFIFMIIALVNALNGQWYRIPVVANLADWLLENVKV